MKGGAMINEWFLYDGASKQQFQNLDESALKEQLLKYTLKESEQLFVWNESFTDWKPLKDTSELKSLFEECFVERFRKKSPPPPPSMPKAKLPPAVPEIKADKSNENSNNKATSPSKKKVEDKKEVVVTAHAQSLEVTQTNKSVEESRPTDTVMAKPDTVMVKPETVMVKTETTKTKQENHLPKSEAQKVSEPSPESSNTGKPDPKLNLTVSKDMKSLNFSEQRLFARYPLKLKVLIRSKEITFRTFTSNISLGGVALEHAIPDILLEQSCQILIASDHSEENIRFNLILLNQKQGKRLQFEGDANNAARLKSWIEAYLAKHPMEPLGPSAQNKKVG